MKFLRLATIAALTTTAFAGGITAFAEEAREVTTDGQIEFGPNDSENTIVEPPGPGEPDVTIPPVPPGTTGPLTISYAPTMDFGQQVISNQDQAYNLVAEMQQLTGTEGDENKVPYISFAQVQDTRGTNAGWDLRVTLSNFTAENTQNNILTGSRIEFRSPELQYNGNNPDNAPTIHADGLMLEAGGAAQSVLSAAERRGAGTSSVVWGDQADLSAQFADDEIDVVENEMIRLHVPGATVKDAAMYTATLDWELNDVPGMTGESR
ncbi:hypothetical protein IGJ74_000820 [Enterococcus sp. AZ009]|uniref:WxL domain-containing protein n=1 Tax=Enterococcus TaxID=1350 RepID=UPI001C46FF38|nr:WxL domain-containing protein [Enterococcus casseliflavus]